MTESLVIVALWWVFAATHMGMSSLAWRPRLIGVLGARGFLGAYSVAAIVVFSGLVWYYIAHRHLGPVLWAVPLGPVGLWAIYGLQGVAWTLVLGGTVQPSPATTGTFAPGTAPPAAARGIHRITRHATFMGVGLFGALHLVTLGFASDVAFWAGFPIFAVLGCWHQDQRKLATQGPAYRAWHEQTPFWPFSGGRVALALREAPPWLVPAGIALTAALRWLHGPLFR